MSWFRILYSRRIHVQQNYFLKVLNREGWKVDISFLKKKIKGRDNESGEKKKKKKKGPISQHCRQLYIVIPNKNKKH